VDELREVLGRREQRARRAVRERPEHDRLVAVHVTGGEPRRQRAGAPEVSIGDAHRREDLAAQVRVERFATRDLDRACRDGVADVRVRVARAGLPAHPSRPRVERERVANGERFVVGKDLVEPEVVEPRGVLETLRERDRRDRLPRVVDLEVRHELAQRAIEIELALLDQAHHAERDHALRHRADPERGVTHHRRAARAVANADPADVSRAIAADQRECRAGDVLLLEDFRDPRAQLVDRARRVAARAQLADLGWHRHVLVDRRARRRPVQPGEARVRGEDDDGESNATHRSPSLTRKR